MNTKKYISTAKTPKCRNGKIIPTSVPKPIPPKKK